MKLTHQIVTRLSPAVEELGSGKYTFNNQTTCRIARHARKLRGVAEDIQKTQIQMSKAQAEAKDDAEKRLSIENDWMDFLQQEVEVDVSANLKRDELRMWDDGKTDGNKIPASLLATLEPLLEEKD